MTIYDHELEHEIQYQIRVVEIMIDRIAPTPLRHELSEQIVKMRKTLHEFDQKKHEDSLQCN